MGYKPEEIEDLVLAALDAAPLNVYCKTFERYDGQFNVNDVKQIKSSFPSCFAIYGRDRFVPVTRLATYKVEAEVNVVVAQKSLRGDFKARAGTDGALQMLEDVKTILHLNNLGKADIVGLELQRRDPLILTKELAVYILQFKLEFTN